MWDRSSWGCWFLIRVGWSFLMLVVRLVFRAWWSVESHGWALWVEWVAWGHTLWVLHRLWHRHEGSLVVAGLVAHRWSELIRVVRTRGLVVVRLVLGATHRHEWASHLLLLHAIKLTCRWICLEGWWSCGLSARAWCLCGWESIW